MADEVESVTPEANVELNFTISVEEANLILNALGELPAKVSMAVIQKLQAQAQPQLKKDE